MSIGKRYAWPSYEVSKDGGMKEKMPSMEEEMKAELEYRKHQEMMLPHQPEHDMHDPKHGEMQGTVKDIDLKKHNG